MSSYEGMGIARLECVDACECEPQRMDAHKTNEIRNVSVFETHRFAVRASRLRAPREQWHCELALTLLEQTSSGKTKFKIRSITVTSELPHAAAGTTMNASEAASASTSREVRANCGSAPLASQGCGGHGPAVGDCR